MNNIKQICFSDVTAEYPEFFNEHIKIILRPSFIIMDYLQSETNMRDNTVPFPLIKSVDFQPSAPLRHGLNTNTSPLHCCYPECPPFIHYHKLNNYFTAYESFF
jgi:hypothetical protein